MVQLIYVDVERTSKEPTRYHPLARPIPPQLTTFAPAWWYRRRIGAALD